MKTFKEFLNEQTQVDIEKAIRLAKYIERKAESAVNDLPDDLETEFYRGFPPKNPTKLEDYIMSNAADSIGVSLIDIKKFVRLLVGRTSNYDQVYSDTVFKEITNTKDYDKKIRRALRNTKIDSKTFKSIYG